MKNLTIIAIFLVFLTSVALAGSEKLRKKARMSSGKKRSPRNNILGNKE
jgi:hypothetical protein